MSHSEYRVALAGIVHREGEGEDVGHAIASLARRTGMDIENVRQDVIETADLHR